MEDNLKEYNEKERRKGTINFEDYYEDCQQWVKDFSYKYADNNNQIKEVIKWGSYENCLARWEEMTKNK